MKWAAAISVAGALILQGCGNGGVSERLINVASGETAPSQSVTQARFQRLLQAKQGPARNVQIEGTGIRGGFLREARRGTKETWLGTDGVTLTFDRGVLAGTAGFGAALQAADVAPTASAVLAGRTTQVERVHSLLSGNDTTILRAFVCDIEVSGSEVIELDTRNTRTRKMTETCYSLDTTFTNEYWVDPRRGAIVQSRQWAGEEVGTLRIRNVYNF